MSATYIRPSYGVSSTDIQSPYAMSGTYVRSAAASSELGEEIDSHAVCGTEVVCVAITAVCSTLGLQRRCAVKPGVGYKGGVVLKPSVGYKGGGAAVQRCACWGAVGGRCRLQDHTQ
eukprot:684042-Rhodomonas_salina.1